MGKAASVMAAAVAEGMNLRQMDGSHVSVAFDETSTLEDVDTLFAVLSGAPAPFTAESVAAEVDTNVGSFKRTSEFLTHPIFNSYHSEHEMLRYLARLEAKDLSLCHSMIPLGSCTMKLNSSTEMMPITMGEFANMHPFAPEDQAAGYKEMIENLADILCEVTGFDAMSMQPNSGASGEYAGLMTIRAYHQSNGDHHRNVCIIPVSAHGTNPASAVMAGMKIVTCKTDKQGNVDLEDLAEKIEANKDNLGALMVTYPSTYGVYEEKIDQICTMIHDNGGQVYMDGANMNAQVGLTSPGLIGADVCHLNLHKTFAIPHGGGGPGMGPIGVKAHLAPFLPSHPVDPEAAGKLCGSNLCVAKSEGAIAGAPFGSAAILPISWMYIKMNGYEGLKKATEVAILNANYMAARLTGAYDVLFVGKNGQCAHEFILDLRPLKAATGVTEEDAAKRLQDYGFHSPTMSWPVAGTLMVEPTESEDLAELNRFCDAMLSIRSEIDDIGSGRMALDDSPLRNAPHTIDDILDEKWGRKYTRETGAYPSPWVRPNKFWPSCGRVDNVYGDRNLVCTCPPLSAYEEEENVKKVA